MRPTAALLGRRPAIRRAVAAHRLSNPRVFGSVARGEDDATSDLDLLVDPSPHTSLFDIGALRQELLDLLSVPVDVVTPGGLPPAIRDRVLAEAVPL